MLANRMRLVDAHAHLIPVVQGRVAAGEVRDLGYGRISFGPDSLQLMPPLQAETTFTAEMLMAGMDWAGVDAAVVLQGTYYGPCNDYARAAISRYAGRLAGMAWLDPWAGIPGDAQAEFARIFETPGFRGVKVEFSVSHGLSGLHPGVLLDGPEVEWLWDALERRGLALTLDLGGIATASYQTDAVRAVAEHHPGLTVVIAHLGIPTHRAESDPNQWREWEAQIDLGRLPNVWFDTAALPIFLRGDEAYPFPSVRRYLQMAVERIGAVKVMWGTDVPGLLVVATQLQLAELAVLHSDFLSPSEQAAYLAGNAAQVYGL
jgi:predicted TIM-barrel fold metal-dependent hydrolase